MTAVLSLASFTIYTSRLQEKFCSHARSATFLSDASRHACICASNAWECIASHQGGDIGIALLDYILYGIGLLSVCLSVRPHLKLSTNVIADRPFFARTTGTGRTPALRSFAAIPQTSPELFDPQSSNFCVLYMQIRANFNFNFIFSSML